MALYLRCSNTNEIPWVNPSPQDRLTALKPYQLKLALELGFTIPETIFSNSSTEVRSFVREGKKFIYKQISNFMFPPSDYVFTNEISAETLEGKEHNIRAAPGIYQELIEKSAEWRITVIGDQLFSVRIDSQSLPITSLDWRRISALRSSEVLLLTAIQVEKYCGFIKRWAWSMEPMILSSVRTAVSYSWNVILMVNGCGLSGQPGSQLLNR